MTNGPLGGPRPFANESCELVLVYHLVGIPRSNRQYQVFNELESDLHNNVRVPIKSVYIETGDKRNNSNSATIVVELSKSAKPSEIKDWSDRLVNEIEGRGRLGDVMMSSLQAGDPELLARGVRKRFG